MDKKGKNGRDGIGILMLVRSRAHLQYRVKLHFAMLKLKEAFFTNTIITKLTQIMILINNLKLHDGAHAYYTAAIVSQLNTI